MLLPAAVAWAVVTIRSVRALPRDHRGEPIVLHDGTVRPAQAARFATGERVTDSVFGGGDAGGGDGGGSGGA